MAFMTRLEVFSANITTTGNGCIEWTGRKQKDGYGVIYNGKFPGGAHRWSYEHYVGPIPEGMEVDHTCYNRACVNPDHLRVVTRKQNRENLGGLRADNSSGYRGVSWCTRAGKWQAQVKHNGKGRHLGYFDDPQEAHEAALKVRNELFTHNDLDRAI